MIQPCIREQPPLGLYVHIPWCVRKCPYCDFNSHEMRAGGVAESQYVDQLILDFQQECHRRDLGPVETIFMGGGTPSLFSAPAIAEILQAVGYYADLAGDAEITLEANPGASEHSKYPAFAKAGVNRLSIGVQSFDDALLARIGRIHDAETAKNAVQVALASGFASVNIDLMFALPGQSVAKAMQDLQTAIALQPQHISWYQLTLEPNTLFHRQAPELPDLETQWTMYTRGRALLQAAGYQQYEVSAYAREDRRCKHNVNYWLFGDYLGIGAGAHGKLSFTESGVVERTMKHKHPNRYLQVHRNQQDWLATCAPVARADLPLEFMMNGLRLVDGFRVDCFEARTGCSIAPWVEVLQASQAEGLLFYDSQHIRPSARGLRYLNDLLLPFMPD